MNTIISKQEVGILKPSNLPDWLLSHGIPTITTEECAHLFGIPVNEVPQRLVRLRGNGHLVSVARGLWAVVPAEYREMGAPEPFIYIDPLMNYYGCDYCVGWLSSAAMQGARHQASQVFQVAVDRHIRKRQVGRSELQFFDRSYIKELSKRRVTTSRGTVVAASPAATMLMVSSDLIISGGIDNAATIITELAEENPDYEKDLIKDASLFPRASVARLGWILERITGECLSDDLAHYCNETEFPTALSSYDKRKGRVDKRWNVIENRAVEADI